MLLETLRKPRPEQACSGVIEGRNVSSRDRGSILGRKAHSNKYVSGARRIFKSLKRVRRRSKITYLRNQEAPTRKYGILTAEPCERLKRQREIISRVAKRIFANLIQSNANPLLSSVSISRRIPFASSYRDFRSNETINFVLSTGGDVKARRLELIFALHFAMQIQRVFFCVRTSWTLNQDLYERDVEGIKDINGERDKVNSHDTPTGHRWY